MILCSVPNSSTRSAVPTKRIPSSTSTRVASFHPSVTRALEASRTTSSRGLVHANVDSGTCLLTGTARRGGTAAGAKV